MSETNQDLNSTLPDFDEDMNDLLTRRYILTKTLQDLVYNSFTTLDQKTYLMDSLLNEIKDIEKEIKTLLAEVESNG